MGGIWRYSNEVLDRCRRSCLVAHFSFRGERLSVTCRQHRRCTRQESILLRVPLVFPSAQIVEIRIMQETCQNHHLRSAATGSAHEAHTTSHSAKKADEDRPRIPSSNKLILRVADQISKRPQASSCTCSCLVWLHSCHQSHSKNWVLKFSSASALYCASEATHCFLFIIDHLYYERGSPSEPSCKYLIRGAAKLLDHGEAHSPIVIHGQNQ